MKAKEQIGLEYFLFSTSVLKSSREFAGFNDTDLKVLTLIRRASGQDERISTKEIIRLLGMNKDWIYKSVNKLLEGGYIDHANQSRRFYDPKLYSINGKGSYLFKRFDNKIKSFHK